MARRLRGFIGELDWGTADNVVVAPTAGFGASCDGCIGVCTGPAEINGALGSASAPGIEAAVAAADDFCRFEGGEELNNRSC